MTAKGAALTWAEEDNNFLLLLNFCNLIGAAFNDDGTINVESPASTQIIKAVMPFLGPIGEVIWMPCEMDPGKLSPDNGAMWVECTGQTQLNQADYPMLFAVYGIKYNQPLLDNPATQFRTPDARDKFLHGRNAAGEECSGFPTLTSGLYSGAGFGGEHTHKLLSSESGVPAHDHDVIIPGDAPSDSINTLTIQGDGSLPQTFTTNNNTPADAANAHNNMPPYVRGVFYVRAGYKLGGAVLPA
jgi:hypothetical protein